MLLKNVSVLFESLCLLLLLLLGVGERLNRNMRPYSVNNTKIILWIKNYETYFYIFAHMIIILFTPCYISYSYFKFSQWCADKRLFREKKRLDLHCCQFLCCKYSLAILIPAYASIQPQYFA